MSVECQVQVKTQSELDIGGRETCSYRKDVRLPVHLQRAMAAEAEAAREARAKVKFTNLNCISKTQWLTLIFCALSSIGKSHQRIYFHSRYLFHT